MKTPSYSCGSRTRGFTLIEIAIVIAIAALLVAAGIGISVAVLDNARARATKQNMESVRLAIQSFIARNGRLPCPAVETLGPTNAMYGIEAATAGTCTGTVDLPVSAGVEAAKRGVVPWKTLGITLETASDGWFDQITYMVTTTATGKTFETVSGMRGSLYLHSALPVSAGLPPTGNQINACSTTANENSCNRAAVVMLISHGRNRFGAYTADGVRVPTAGAGPAELENTNDDRFVVSAEPAQTYDDIVIPLTPDDFLNALSSQGAVKSERSMLVERARQAVILIASEAVNTRAGAPGTYVYTLPTPVSTSAFAFVAARFNANCNANPPNTIGLLPAGHDGKLVLDPWGQEFRYQTANDAINSGESCPHPGVLVSMGPDLTLGTADDWVYYVPLAEWKDVFSKAGW